MGKELSQGRQNQTISCLAMPKLKHIAKQISKPLNIVDRDITTSHAAKRRIKSARTARTEVTLEVPAIQIFPAYEQHPR
jgi:hypothetical protein